MRFRQSSADADLVWAVLKGHKDSFAALVDRYRDLVYGTILSQVADLDEADDLAQEAFLKAYHRLDTLHDPRKFGPWLRRIGENLAHTYLRNKAIRQIAPEDFAPPATLAPDETYES